MDFPSLCVSICTRFGVIKANDGLLGHFPSATTCHTQQWHKYPSYSWSILWSPMIGKNEPMALKPMILPFRGLGVSKTKATSIGWAIWAYLQRLTTGFGTLIWKTRFHAPFLIYLVGWVKFGQNAPMLYDFGGICPKWSTNNNFGPLEWQVMHYGLPFGPRTPQMLA